MAGPESAPRRRPRLPDTSCGPIPRPMVLCVTPHSRTLGSRTLGPAHRIGVCRSLDPLDYSNACRMIRTTVLMTSRKVQGARAASDLISASLRHLAGLHLISPVSCFNAEPGSENSLGRYWDVPADLQLPGAECREGFLTWEALKSEPERRKMLALGERSGLGGCSRRPRASTGGVPSATCHASSPRPSRAVTALEAPPRAPGASGWVKGASGGPYPSGPRTDHRRNTKPLSRKGYGGAHKQTQIMLRPTGQEPGSQQPIRKQRRGAVSRDPEDELQALLVLE